jgi:aspartyl-tRNA synthetase
MKKKLQQLMEEMIRGLFAEVGNVELPSKFPSISYADAIKLYGVDRPDLRIPLI